MTDPASSVAAGAAAFKAVGGASAVAAGGAVFQGAFANDCAEPLVWLSGMGSKAAVRVGLHVSTR